jgi:hypothetical protein
MERLEQVEQMEQREKLAVLSWQLAVGNGIKQKEELQLTSFRAAKRGRRAKQCRVSQLCAMRLRRYSSVNAFA